MNNIEIFKSTSKGQVRIPASKSDAHRKIIAASLCFGQTSIIDNVDFSNDINQTLEAMKNFASIQVEGRRIIITAIKPSSKEASFNALESGSTLRFLIPLFSYFFDKTTIFGTKRLLERPLSIYQDIYEDGLKISDHILLTKKIKPGNYQIRGDISSQFISGLLFILPLLEEDSKIEIVGNYESKSYVNLTLDVLSSFGIEIEEKDHTYFIKGNQEYHSIDTQVEGDYSQLAFFAVLGLINHDVEVTNVKKDSIQGDLNIINILRSLGGKIESTKEGYLFKKSELVGTTIDLENNPDLGPILFVLSPFCKGETRFINTRRLRIKESDRVEAMKEELLKYGVEIKDFENEVVIKEQEVRTPKEEIDTHNDHRILMACSILSTLVGGKIKDIKCVNKSYPKFFEDLFTLGVKGVYYDR